MQFDRVDRKALRSAYRMEEGACVAERLQEAADVTRLHPRSRDLAAQLIEGARRQSSDGLDDFLNS